MKRLFIPWATIFGDGGSGAKRFIPATPWMQASAVRRLRAVWELAAPQTNLNAIFAYQTANVENSPDLPANEVGSPLSTATVSYGTLGDVSSVTNGKLLIRFGWNVWYGAGSTTVFGRTGGTIEYDACV